MLSVRKVGSLIRGDSMKIELFEHLEDARAFISERLIRQGVGQELTHSQRTMATHFMDIWMDKFGDMTTIDYLCVEGGAWKIVYFKDS